MARPARKSMANWAQQHLKNIMGNL